MENHPTNGELALMIGSVSEKLDLHRVDSSNRDSQILVQATKTNGRVTALEQWRWTMTGGLAVIIVLIVPLLLDLAKRSFK